MKVQRILLSLGVSLTVAAGGGPAFGGRQCAGAMDGTPCVSGDRCSRGDYCRGGVCYPGVDTIECPSPDPCRAGVCDPLAGCLVVDVCAADGGDVLVPPRDKKVDAGPAHDAGDVRDGGALDGGALDGGALDGGALDGGALDGGALDGGALDGGVDSTDGAAATAPDPPQHVVGSGLAGCSLTAGAWPAPIDLPTILLIALAVRWGRKKAARYPR